MGPSGDGGLPGSPDRTIGRESDVEAIARRLGARDKRLLTLTGPGGVGKTRLALEAARAVETEFADGARFVPLATLTDATNVPRAIVQALRIVSIAGESQQDAALRFLRAKQLLLVLDNIEHLLDAAGSVAALLAECPRLTVLATSREALALAGEECYPVGPLAVSGENGGADGSGRAAAVTLFADRARARDPAFALTPATAAAVATICRRVDGLPLAIELAAARCNVLSPAEIAARLEGTSAVLGRGPRDAPARQRTLRATIDWSLELLDEGERGAFAAFAVFAGGATVEAAEAVTGADLDTLEQLTAKSLLVRERSGAGSRLRMLATIRAYAAERLAADPRATVIRERHFDCYLQLARRHGDERALRGPHGSEHLAALDIENDNLDAALRSAIDASDGERGVAMAAALGRYWLMKNRYADAIHWIARALALPGADRQPAPLVHALCIEALALWPLGRRAEEEEALFARAEAVAREAGDPAPLAWALATHADRAMSRDRLDVAETLSNEALALATAAADDWTLALAAYSNALAAQSVEQLRERVDNAAALLERVGNVLARADLLSSSAYAAMCMSSDGDARRLIDRAIPQLRAFGTPYQWMMLQGNLGLAALLTGDAATADEAFRQELILCRDLVVLPFATEALTGLAALAATRGEDHRAATLVGAAIPYRHGGAKDPLETRLDRLIFQPARERHGARAWDEAVEHGATLAFEDAFAYALEERTG